MMKNIAISAAAVAVCTGATGVMAMDTQEGRQEGGSAPLDRVKKNNGEGGADEKKMQAAAAAKAGAEAKAAKKKSIYQKSEKSNFYYTTEELFKDEKQWTRFGGEEHKMLTHEDIKVLERTNGHFVVTHENGQAVSNKWFPQYYRFQVQPPTSDLPKAAAGEGKKPIEKPTRETYDLEVRQAPGVLNAYGFAAGKFEKVSKAGDNWSTVTLKKNATEGGDAKTLTLQHVPCTYFARFCQIFFGFQQGYISAFFRCLFYAAAAYCIYHLLFRKKAASDIEDDEVDSECDSDSEIDDMESGLSSQSPTVRLTPFPA